MSNLVACGFVDPVSDVDVFISGDVIQAQETVLVYAGRLTRGIQAVAMVPGFLPCLVLLYKHQVVIIAEKTDLT